MRKDQFIEIVKGILTGGDDNPDLQEKYHEQRIILVASMAFNSAIYQVFSRQLDEKDLYVRAYDVDVQYDSTHKQFFAKLPGNVVQLPMNSGIHKISPISERWSFNPINQLSEDVFEGLEVGELDQDPSYYFDYQNVYFQYYDWKQEKIQRVRIWLVPPLEDYADSDPLIIPAGKEDLILQFVRQHLGTQMPTDDSPNLDDKQV